MITFYHRTTKDEKLNTLQEFKVGAWIHAEAPSFHEVGTLVKDFSLEEGLLQDALDPFEVPRMEIVNGSIYIFTRAPHEEENRVSTVPVLIIIGAKFLMTISQKPAPFMQKFLKGELPFYTTQKVKMVMQMFGELNGIYSGFLLDINRQMRNITGNLENINNKEIVKFVHFEGVLNDFLAGLVPTNTILSNLLSGKFVKLFVEDKDIIEDLFLSNGQLIERCKSALNSIVNVREAYSTIITNNLNYVIKLLTALTIVFTIPTMIASFYGMNVALPFESSPFAFWGVVIFTVVLSLVLLWVFVQNKWLK